MEEDEETLIGKSNNYDIYVVLAHKELHIILMSILNDDLYELKLQDHTMPLDCRQIFENITGLYHHFKLHLNVNQHMISIDDMGIIKVYQEGTLKAKQKKFQCVFKSVKIIKESQKIDLLFQIVKERKIFCKNHHNQHQKINQTQSKNLIKNNQIPSEMEIEVELEMNLTDNSVKGMVGLIPGKLSCLNSIFQCLSHTKILTDYFLGSFYSTQMNPQGTKGILVKSYAQFIKNSWCGQLPVIDPDYLQNSLFQLNQKIIELNDSDLNKIYEIFINQLSQDLNRVKNQPESLLNFNIESVDNGIAFNSWAKLLLKKQSIIMDLMEGQLQIKTQCPSCAETSIAFTSFITLTLPLPKKANSELECSVIYSNFEQKAVKVSFEYDQAQLNCKEMLKQITKKIQREENQFLMYVVSKDESVYRADRYSTVEILEKYQQRMKKNMFIIQLSKQQRDFHQRVQLVGAFRLKITDNNYSNLWYKFPFFFEKETTTGFTIYKRILRFLYKQAFTKQPMNYQTYENKMLKQRPFDINLQYERLITKRGARFSHEFQKDLPLKDYMKLSDLLSQINQNDCQLDIVIHEKTCFYLENLNNVEKPIKKINIKKQTKSIDNDIQIFSCFKMMKASTQSAQFCQLCRINKIEIKKLYKAPNILNIHLKRFHQQNNKNEIKVKFPLILDLQDHLLEPKPMSTYMSEGERQKILIGFPYSGNLINISMDPVYELYAVINHDKNHFTAFAKHNESWYEFDDKKVQPIKESSIVSNQAYMLFYKRLEFK